MNGRRMPDGTKPSETQPGDYWKNDFGWWVNCPTGFVARLQHEVEEHEDGTITVSPSILLDHPPDKAWHGFLERGVWRSV